MSRVGNVSEFFKKPWFGSEISEASRKTNQQYQGKSIYQEKSSVGNYIKKGDRYYLDGIHGDHIEVFDKNGNMKSVLNLDGSINEIKTKAALQQGRRIQK